MGSQKIALESIAFALLVLHIATQLDVLLYAAAMVLLLSITEPRWVTPLVQKWIALVSFVGATLFKTLLAFVFFIVITPYSVIFRYVSHTRTFDEWKTGKKSNYIERDDVPQPEVFERPW